MAQQVLDNIPVNTGPIYADDFVREWQPSQLTYLQKYAIRWLACTLLIFSGAIVGTYLIATLPNPVDPPDLTFRSTLTFQWWFSLFLSATFSAAVGCLYCELVIKLINKPKRFGWNWLAPTVGFLTFLIINFFALPMSMGGWHSIAVLISTFVLIFLIHIWPYLFKEFSFGWMLRDLRRLWAYRALIYLWVKFRIQASYSSSVLGILWAVLDPCLSAIMYAFIFSVLRARPPDDGIPFTVYMLPAMIFFRWMTSIFNGSTRQLVGDLGNLSKVNYPRETGVLVFAVQKSVDLFIAITFFALIMLFFGQSPSLHFFLALPIILISFIGLIGIALFLSVSGVIVRDTSEVIGLISQPLLFIMPILFGFSQMTGIVRWFNVIFPFPQAIVALRRVTVYGLMPDGLSIMYLIISCLLLLYIGYTFFSAKSSMIIDYM